MVGTNAVEGWCLKDPMMGQCERIIGKGQMDVRHNEVMVAFRRVGYTGDLHRHRMYRPSLILR